MVFRPMLRPFAPTNNIGRVCTWKFIFDHLCIKWHIDWVGSHFPPPLPPCIIWCTCWAIHLGFGSFNNWVTEIDCKTKQTPPFHFLHFLSISFSPQIYSRVLFPTPLALGGGGVLLALSAFHSLKLNPKSPQHERSFGTLKSEKWDQLKSLPKQAQNIYQIRKSLLFF